MCLSRTIKCFIYFFIFFRFKHSLDCVIVDSGPISPGISKIAEIASRTTHIQSSPVVTVGVVTPKVTPTPKRRGRPRKVQLFILKFI